MQLTEKLSQGLLHLLTPALAPAASLLQVAAGYNEDLPVDRHSF
jgi:hypothetical protein